MAKFKVGDLVIVKTREQLLKLKGTQKGSILQGYDETDVRDSVVDDCYISQDSNGTNYGKRIFKINDFHYTTKAIAYRLEGDTSGLNFYDRWLIPVKSKTAKVLFSDNTKPKKGKKNVRTKV